MNIKRIIMGSPEPDINNPKVKKHYDNCKSAGGRFARFLHLDAFFFRMQKMAVNHSKAFFIVVFSMSFCIILSCVCRIVVFFTHTHTPHRTEIITPVKRPVIKPTLSSEHPETIPSTGLAAFEVKMGIEKKHPINLNKESLKHFE